MHSRFVLNNSCGQYTFSLKTAGNNQILLTSKRYARKASALAGIAAVRACADSEDRYRRRRSRRRESYFVLRAYDGEVVGTSEMYSSAGAREAIIATVQAQAPTANVEDHTEAARAELCI